MNRFLITFAVCLTAAACGGTESGTSKPLATPAASPVATLTPDQMPKVDQTAILERIKLLASDEYERRAPGTKGEELTVRYLVEESKKLGLQPGNPDGTYVQRVLLVGITGAESRLFTVTKGAQKRTLKW